MEPVALSLVMIACLFVLGAAGEMIFAKTQIPDVVWLIAAGVFFRVTGLVDPADKRCDELFAACRAQAGEVAELAGRFPLYPSRQAAVVSE